MSAFGWIGEILTSGKAVAEVFTENKEKKSQRKHDAFIANNELDRAALQEFAAEFHQRNRRTWWDAFIDGLNRLPRPLLTFSIIGFFVLAPLNPEKFLEIAKAYEVMPAGYWALLSVIVGFYFGGRMQIKSQDMMVKKEAIQAAKEMMTLKKSFRALPDDFESQESKTFDAAIAAGKLPELNFVVEDWLQEKRRRRIKSQ